MTDRASAEGLREAAHALWDFLEHEAIWTWVDDHYTASQITYAQQLRLDELHDALGAALRDTGSRPDSGIDVERLAEALHESDLMRRYSEYADAVPTMTPTPEHTLCIEWAAIIAAEYARLSTPRTETSDGLLDAERDALL